MSIPDHAAALSGTWNFRDVGGITTADGPVRRGVVYRSAVLSRLDPEGQAALESLGVTDVFDLRGTREIAAEGADQVPDSVTVRHAPFNPEDDDTPVHEAAEAAADPRTPVRLHPRLLRRSADHAVGTTLGRLPAAHGGHRAGQRAGALRGREGPDRLGHRGVADRGRRGSRRR